MSNMQDIAKQVGITVLRDHEVDVAKWGLLYAILAGAKGVYNHKFPTSVLVMSTCEEEEQDYVISHEMGHVLSFMHGHTNKEFYAKAKKECYEAHKFMSTIEECRADNFSLHLCTTLGLYVPEWVHSFRMKQYEQDIPQFTESIKKEAIWMAENYVLNRLK